MCMQFNLKRRIKMANVGVAIDKTVGELKCIFSGLKKR